MKISSARKLEGNSESERPSILVIDDNSEMLKLHETILQLNNFSVFTAQSGAKAFQVLDEITKPDLILLDVRMHDMTGPEFLSELQEKKPEIVNRVPIVFHSCMNSVPIGKAAGFMQKATGIDAFLNDVRRFIELGKHSPYKSNVQNAEFPR